MTPWLEPTLTQLWQLALQQTLHHGLLITGARGVGKTELIQALVERLLCQQPSQAGACGNCKSCHLFRAGHHPDLHQVTTEQSISVDAIREVSVFLQQAAQQGGRRLVVVPQAHKMTEAAANALLKTLEEPGADTFILLSSEQPELLLATIRSRCQQWTIAVPTTALAKPFLLQQMDAEAAEFLLAVSAGAPFRALALYQTGQYPLLQSGFELLQQILRQQIPLLPAVQKLETLTALPELLRLALMQQLANAAEANQFAALNRYQTWCRDGMNILGQNKNLALTACLADLSRLLR